MKKTLFALLAILSVSSFCFGMGTIAPPASIYTGQPTYIVTGEVVSINAWEFKNCIQMNVVDDNKNQTVILLWWGTTNRFFNPSNKRLEITYFVNNNGKNVALTANEVINGVVIAPATSPIVPAATHETAATAPNVTTQPGATIGATAAAPAVAPNPGATNGTTAGINKQRTINEFSIAVTFSNTYNIGDKLKHWMDCAMDSGSSNFIDLEWKIFPGVDPTQSLYWGLGMSMDIPVSDAISGSSSGSTLKELSFEPYLFSFNVPFRMNLIKDSLTMTLVPSFILAYCLGEYNGAIEDAPRSAYPATATGCGFGLYEGTELSITDNLGMEVKIGARMLNAAISIDTGSHGDKTPTDNHGDDISLDLGGFYMTLGCVYKF